LAPGAELPRAEIVEPAESPQRSDQGYIGLRWSLRGAKGGERNSEATEGVAFELQQATSPAFEDPVTRYEGADRGSVLTGFREGAYYFRVRGKRDGRAGPWSAPMKFVVDYMDRAVLLRYLTAGAAVFVLTVGAIVAGHRRAVRQGGAER